MEESYFVTKVKISVLSLLKEMVEEVYRKRRSKGFDCELRRRTLSSDSISVSREIQSRRKVVSWKLMECVIRWNQRWKVLAEVEVAFLKVEKKKRKFLSMTTYLQ